MDPYDSDNSDGGPEFPSQSTIPEPLPFNVLRVGRASVAIRRIVHSYTPTLVYSAGQEPAGKAQLDRDQLFARDSTRPTVFSHVYKYQLASQVE